MPENEFEKQVQQKMDELQFVPSDAVWPEVERQITERKKRRGLIFWLPLGVLLLGGTAWMYFSGSENNVITKQAADKTIANTQEFLRRSAAKVKVTRLVVKYGATRIASVLGAVLILGLCIFYYQDARKKYLAYPKHQQHRYKKFFRCCRQFTKQRVHCRGMGP